MAPTIILECSTAENLDPLNETSLALEQLLRDLSDDGRIVYGDDIKIELKRGMAS
jgi:hypothetical protein